MAAISPTVFKAAIARALAEGEAKGRRLERLERLEFKKWMKQWLSPDYPTEISVLSLNNWVNRAARSKRGKPKERMSR